MGAHTQRLTCGEVQKALYEVNPDDCLVGYVSLPGALNAETRHRRRLWLHHLDVTADDSSSREYVAKHHFRRSAFSDSSQLEVRTTEAEAHPYPAYTDADRVSHFYTGSAGYFNVPNVPASMFQLNVSQERDFSYSLPFLGGPDDAFVRHRGQDSSTRNRKSDLANIASSNPEDVLLMREDYERKLAELVAEIAIKERTIVDLRERSEQLQMSSAKDIAAKKRLEDAAGLSRLRLTSTSYHDDHPNDAAYFFGFRSWAETKTWFQQCYDLNPDTAHQSRILPDVLAGKRNLAEVKMTPFEQFLITTMYMHTDSEQKHLGRIWGVEPRSIGRYLDAWAPLIGDVGQQISILDVDVEWCMYEQPLEYDQADAHTVAAVADGKDFESETIRILSAVRKLLFSDKTGGSAVRCMTFSSKIGAVVDHSGLFCGRVSETALVKAMGSLTKEVPLASWGKGYTEVIDLTEPPRGNLQVLEKYMSKRRELEDAEQEDEQEDVAAGDVKPQINVVESAKHWYLERRAALAANKASGSVDPLSVAGLTAAAEAHIRNHPLQSRKTTLRHYELHERLHRTYKAGDLNPCLLSFYLDFFPDKRRRILQHLGSSLFAEDAVATRPLPRLFPRLAKLPSSWAVLADKGFCKDSVYLPNRNTFITPIRLEAREQYTKGEIAYGRRVKKNRYTCETVFSRVTDVSILRDSIGRGKMRHLNDACSWAHGRANLQQPLLKPKTWGAYLESLN